MSKKAFLEQNQKEGESYAGIVLGINGEPDFHVFAIKPSNPDKTYTWEQAKAYAASVGGELPEKRWASLLPMNAENCKGQTGWHWTATQDSGDTDYAWVQNFNHGSQGDYRKSYEGRARAVRRDLIIQ